MTTRGIRNFNPGNIERGAKWQGLSEKHEMTPEQRREKRFCVFRAPEWGIRAIVKIIYTYERKYSIDTVQGVINRWAPPIENDTQAYIAHVAESMNVLPQEPLNLTNTLVMLRLVRAIIKHENGSQPYDDVTIRTGIALARVKAPKKKPLLASKRLKGGALVTGVTAALTQSQAVINAAREAVSSIAPGIGGSDGGWGLAAVLGAALLAFVLYVAWTAWIDYRSRYETEDIDT